MKRICKLSNVTVALAAAGLLVLGACGKKDTKKDGEGKGGMTAMAPLMGPDMAPAMAPGMRPLARPAAALPKVEIKLPKAGLKAMAPQGTKVTESILPNTDSIKLPGVRSSFVVRKYQAGDKTLEKVIPWAKGHQIQKYGGDVVKKGKGKLYTYIYKVTMGGRKMAVLHQYVQVGKDVYRCFSNADSPASAQLMSQVCDSLKK